jgi:hypothetical protein
MPPRPCRPKFQNELAQGLRNEPDTLNPPGEMARFKADVTGIGSDQCPVWHNCTWALTTESSGEGGYRNLASAAIMGDARIPHGRIGTARFRRERLGAQWAESVSQRFAPHLFPAFAATQYQSRAVWRSSGHLLQIQNVSQHPASPS